MRTMLILVVSGVLLSATAFGADPPATPKAKPDDRDKIVCVSERIVGSNISERTCHTKAEWDAAREDAKHSLDRHNGQLIAPTHRGPGA